MGSRTIGIAVIAALLAIAGLAAAQDASFSVNLEPTSEAGELSPGESASVDVDVNLQGEGFSCAEDEELPVIMEASSGSNVAGTPDSEELIFSNTMGVHGPDSPSGRYNETKTTSVTVEAQNSASSGTYDVTVTGTFPGGNYGPPEGSCGGEFPSAEGTTSIPVTVQAGQSGGGTGGDGTTDTGGTTDGSTGGDDGTDTGGNTTDGGDGGDNGIPLGHWLAPLGLATTALLARRRSP